MAEKYALLPASSGNPYPENTARHAAYEEGRASLAASAGSEPVAPEDYVPMLDDEGRLMVGTSHHYTADNIRALVAEYKALEANAPGSWLKHHNTDHCTRAGVLWRVISALADEVPFTHPSPPEGMAGWTTLPGQLPEPGTPVLLDIGKKFPIRAMWAARFTVPAAEDDTEWGEYHEDSDEYYAPEGWYEWNQNEETHWAVNETPHAWMPLPASEAKEL